MQQTYGLAPAHSFPFMFFGLFGVLLMIIVLIPYWFIFKKAGFSPLFSLLMFVPLVNIVALYFLAFARWNVVPAPTSYSTAPVPYPPQV
jgi:hypothetical protein